MKMLLVTVTFLAFILNFIWENLQMPLYGYAYKDFWQHLHMCFFASIGDVAITMILYSVVGFYKKDWFWIQYIRISDAVTLLLLGFTIAVAVEKFALGSSVWSYAPGMPIIPGLNVGVLPVIQVLFLPPLTFYLTNLIIKKSYVSR